ncbi:hypothetical protein ACSQ67_008781 [Phaseolus vulgaris]
MIGNFIDDIDCGSFFDQIDDLLEFPAEETAAIDTTAVAPLAPPTNFWSAESDSFHAANAVFSGNTVPDLSTELSVPVRFQTLLTSHSSTCALKTRSRAFREPVACSFINAPGFGGVFITCLLLCIVV